MAKEIFLKSGELIGLPDSYLPARFDKEKYILTIKDKSFKFPDFLVNLIKSNTEKQKIKMHASWEHDGDPYITIEFMTEANGGCICFFSLDNLSKLSASKEIPVEGGHRREHITFSEAQQKAIRNGVYQAKK